MRVILKGAGHRSTLEILPSSLEERGRDMKGSRWTYGFAIAVLLLVVLLVAVGLGKVQPGPFFYVMTGFIGVLVYLDYAWSRSREVRRDALNDPEDATPEGGDTAPNYREPPS
jgi:hypothetical protein